MKPEYEPGTKQQIIGYLVEEAGEVLAAAGKTLRWGPDSYNPELQPGEPLYRETNAAWVLREILDLEGAIARFRRAFAPPPSAWRPAAGCPPAVIEISTSAPSRGVITGVPTGPKNTNACSGE